MNITHNKAWLYKQSTSFVCEGEELISAAADNTVDTGNIDDL